MEIVRTFPVPDSFFHTVSSRTLFLTFRFRSDLAATRRNVTANPQSMEVAVGIDGLDFLLAIVEDGFGRMTVLQSANLQSAVGFGQDERDVMLGGHVMCYLTDTYLQHAIVCSADNRQMLLIVLLVHLGLHQLHGLATAHGINTRIHQLDNHIAANRTLVDSCSHSFNIFKRLDNTCAPQRGNTQQR